ncbi:MAG: hypothetical protein ACI9KE_002995 [Polyangiales bacterium]|jgi:hypothetical protein
MVRQTLLLFAFGLGCASDPVVNLSVDLRSDYLPGTEVAQVVTRLELGEGFERRVTTDIDERIELSDGTRIAIFDSIELGSYQLHVDAFDDSGESVASRLGVVEMRGDLAVTIVLSRVCRGRPCPSVGDDLNATECVTGVCVPPECFPETPSLCGTPCSDDDECPNEGCAVGVCADSLCQVTRDPSICPSGMCGSDFRCTAAMDAATDAGPPPEPDAGPPPPSCPANARSCPNTLIDWQATTEWFCRGDERIARAVHRAVCRVCNEGGCTDCSYGNIDVDCRCTEPSTCSSGRCTSGVSLGSSRCDEGSMDNNFSCREITDVVCR